MVQYTRYIKENVQGQHQVKLVTQIETWSHKKGHAVISLLWTCDMVVAAAVTALTH